MEPQIQPLEVDDFSGGLTDYYIDGPSNKAKTLKNFVIVPYGDKGKLKTRPGSVAYDTTVNQPGGVSERIGSLINHDNNSYLLATIKRKIYRKPTSGAYVEVTGPSGNPCFGNGDESNIVSWTTWNKHTYVTNDHSTSNVMRLYDEGGTLKLRNAGLPALASNPTLTSTGGAGNNYVYAFAYYYTYTIGSVTFEDFGAVKQISISNVGAPNVNQIDITTIPVISNGGTENYDTSNIKVYIYRTQNNGTTFYYEGQVTNGTTTFTSNSSDATISANALLYTTGGVVDNDPPPKARFLHVTNDIMWYAYVIENSQTKTNRIRQSIRFDPDSCPEDFYVDVEDDITGISSVQSVPIVFTKRYAYRLDGFFDEFGRGGIQAQRISDIAGCISNQSIVQTDQGLYYAGPDGFYFCDGYKCDKITRDLPTTYKNLVTGDSDDTSTQVTLKQNRIYGTHDSINRRILWAVNSSFATDNDSILCLHMYWGTRPDMPVTLWSNSDLADYFSPTALMFYTTQATGQNKSELLRADRRGYLFKHREDTDFTDPRIDTAANVSAWGTVCIIYNYVSCAINFGTDLVRKWVPRILVQADNATNLSLQVYSMNDANPATKALKEIRYRGNKVWGDPEDTWGNAIDRWNYTGFIEKWLRFPSGGLRCSYKQVQMTNSYTVVTNSDILSTATVNSAANTATLTDTVTYDWPTDSIDYYLSFENDSYVNQFQVSAVTANTLTFLDSANISPVTGDYQWLLKGYRKGEVLNLLGYTIHYAYLSKSQNTFHGTASETGANS